MRKIIWNRCNKINNLENSNIIREFEITQKVISNMNILRKVYLSFFPYLKHTVICAFVMLISQSYSFQISWKISSNFTCFFLTFFIISIQNVIYVNKKDEWMKWRKDMHVFKFNGSKKIKHLKVHSKVPNKPTQN